MTISENMWKSDCFSGVSSKSFQVGDSSSPFCLPDSLRVALLPCFVSFVLSIVSRVIRAIDEGVLGGFFAVEDGAAALADGYAGFDFFGADGAIVQGLGVVEPRFFEA